MSTQAELPPTGSTPESLRFAGTSQTPSSAPEQTRVGRHWLSLVNDPDIAQAPTELFERTQVELADCVSKNGIAAVSGPPGTGKSFSVDYFLRCHPVMHGRDHRMIQLGNTPSIKATTLHLVRGLGIDFDRRDNEFELAESLVQHLRGSEMVIAIDEAENVRKPGMQQLRYLHDRCSPKSPDDPPGFTLILIGTTIDRTLGNHAELSNRVSNTVQFTKLNSTDIVVALRAAHPLWQELPPGWLLTIDEGLCRGNWRIWSQLLIRYQAEREAIRPTSPTEIHEALQRAVNALQKG